MDLNLLSYYFGCAWSAAKCSPDKSVQNGVVLVIEKYNDRHKSGCNHFPLGTVVDDRLLDDRDAKLARIVHAECDAIVQAAKCGWVCDGATMYAIWAACPKCASHIVDAGITRLVRLKWHSDNCPERWRRDVEAGDQILRDGKVDVLEYDGLVDGFQPIRFNGQLVSPAQMESEVGSVKITSCW